MNKHLTEMSELQQKNGYKFGTVNALAILGIYGEASEVIDEVDIVAEKTPAMVEQSMYTCVEYGKMMDKMKKDIRNGKMGNTEVIIHNFDKFDEELADLLYYVNALALGRGKTLDEIAQISNNKIKRYAAKAAVETVK
jgi:NTP pyrophosphatase (non-canonical NTP hydrolase)